jgi:hypothetical protein
MAAERPPRGAVRLTFSYERDDVRLVDRRRVDMMAPPGEPDRIPRRASGFWVELRDARNRVLYQRVVRQPVRFEAEAFGDKPGDPLGWRPVADPSGSFALVVPDLPGGETVALVSSPFEPEAAGEPARDLLSVPLRDDAPPADGKEAR